MVKKNRMAFFDADALSWAYEYHLIFWRAKGEILAIDWHKDTWQVKGW